MRRSAVRAVAALILVAITLTGCIGIPRSGPVNNGRPFAAEDSLELDIIVPGPMKDATQQQILDGFIEAAQSPRNNYQVAREFLTPTFSGQWEADRGATVDVRALRTRQQVDETSTRVLATPVAALTVSGQYENPSSSAVIPLAYHFEKVQGQWRIAEAPPGILIDEISFYEVFRPYPLYFFDPSYRYLVPDLRWFAGRDSVQTNIVMALLAGPSEWLAPGVISAFSEGVRLIPMSVPVAGRVASVNLVGESADDAITVQRMRAQITASLAAVRRVDGVSLKIAGVTQDVPDPPTPPATAPPAESRPLVGRGDVFGYLATTGNQVTPLPEVSSQVMKLAPTSVAVGTNAQAFAVQSPIGVSLVRVGAAPVLLDSRPHLVAPVLDNQHIVWSVPENAPTDLLWYSREGKSTAITVPWTGTRIVAIQMSSDGTRLAALVSDGLATQLVVVAVARSATGEPIKLGQTLQRFPTIANNPVSLAWLDANTVAVLSTTPSGSTKITTQVLGGVATVRSGPDGGVVVLVGNGMQGVRVLTTTGDLDAPSGVGWQVVASGIRFASTQPGS
ncbi:MAG: hypothetical protein B5766_12720 [Candidatus Lumbricidophila eiseniae]|uniref:GerMN domain-containing protein n=1 Tax=Candidatus Lumbricidiphila eiseniae TaxID=1969409 RepID=A0A2A6FNK6_9MICO|nr:MAG: hypothetical protein B5766_12720 [Candidatus Lumbricidophila eiseniae]